MTGWRAVVLIGLFALASLALGRVIRDDLLGPPGDAVPGPPSARGTPGAGGGGGLSPEDYAPPPLGRFSEAFERPLFAPDRRPPAAEPDAPAPEPVRDARLDAVLKGVVLSGERGVALVAEDAGASPVPVAVGERYRGWRLVSIEPGQAVFERDGRRVSLALSYRDRAAPR